MKFATTFANIGVSTKKKYGDSDEGWKKLTEEKCEKCVLNKLI